MLCDHCNERMASVVLTQAIGGKQIKLYLCDKCASQTEGFLMNDFNSFSQFLSTLMNAKGTPKNEVQKCEKCGMTIEDFKKNSKVGCAHCYTTFSSYFGSLVKRIHTSGVHTGKRPETHEKEGKIIVQINQLQEDLKRAIGSEEYEVAARIRDEIKLLKQGRDQA